MKNKYNIPIDKKVVIYFGSYNSGMNDIEILGDALVSLCEQNNNFHFISIGSGNQKEEFINKIKNKISFTHFDSLDSTKVAELVAASDLSLIPRKPIETDTGGNIPVKCFESWACGVPVLLSTIENTEISRIFDECGSGKRISPADSNLFMNEILNLFGRDDLNDLGKKGSEFVKINFDRKIQAEKISIHLSKL